MPTDTVIAFVTGNTVNVMRRTRKGADRIASFVAPTDNVDDICQRTFAILDALTPPPFPAEPDPAAVPTADRPKRRRTAKPGRIPGAPPLLASAQVSAKLIEMGATNEQSAVTVGALYEALNPDTPFDNYIKLLGAMTVPSRKLFDTRPDPSGAAVRKLIWVHTVADENPSSWTPEHSPFGQAV